MSSIFTKIINREITADIVYEEDNIIVIRDIKPLSKTHLLIIPKKEIKTINDLMEDDRVIMSDMFFVAKKVAFELGIQKSYKLNMNVGDLQDVMHIHMHLLSDLG